LTVIGDSSAYYNTMLVAENRKISCVLFELTDAILSLNLNMFLFIDIKHTHIILYFTRFSRGNTIIILCTDRDNVLYNFVVVFPYV